jgi:signal transduction histidine kinase
MKKGLSTYWWCQIVGWSMYVLLPTLFYLSMSGLFIRNILPHLFSMAILGILFTHIMRLFILKAGLLQLNIRKQIVYTFLTTVFFSFIYALVSAWLSEVLHLGDELLKLYNFKNSLNKVNTILLFSYSTFCYLGVWNLIYFSYHYIQRSRRQLIEKMSFENELKVQRLESERIKAELQRHAAELEIKAMIATQEQERKRISRDLHDDIGTKLSALSLFLSCLNEKALVTQNEQIRSLAESSQQFIKEAMQDVRSLLVNLSPSVLEEFGYTTAVEGLVNKINETNMIRFNLVVFGMKERLQIDYELPLYRITQELINNVLKHAAAKQVSLQIGQRDEKIILMMEDDGKGFDVHAHKDGYGLHNLDSRTKLLKGTMIIDSQPGKGTSVLIEIPYNLN